MLNLPLLDRVVNYVIAHIGKFGYEMPMEVWNLDDRFLVYNKTIEMRM